MAKKYLDFNKDWKFFRGEDMPFSVFSKIGSEYIEKKVSKRKASKIRTNLSDKSNQWQSVDLPHDWSIYLDFNMKSLARNEGGLLDGGFGYYKKEFEIEKELIGNNITIHFGAIYMDSSVWINGHFLGNYPFGYLDQYYDISDFVHEGMNEIFVKVEHRQPSSRWYSGSGIYRNVELIVRNKLYIEENETRIVDDILDDNYAKKNVTFLINNKYSTDKKFSIKYSVIDQNDDEILLEKTEEIIIEKHSKKQVETKFEMENPKLWSIENPNLYYLKADLISDDKILDMQITRFGFRYMDWDSDEGFFLNGKYIKFRGVCMHHDNGALGAVQDTPSEIRKLKKLKSMGVNAIRTSHNPQSKEFIRLCDEMGFLVIEEAFDTWSGNRKKEFDYNRFFHKQVTKDEIEYQITWAKYDIQNMVKRDFNSPSIVMWSTGNEIWETKVDYGIELAKFLIESIKRIDDSRYTTIGENGFVGKFGDFIHVKTADLHDAVGLNYGENNFEEIRRNRPNWLLYGAETSSAVKSRGIFYNPSNKDNIVTGSPDKPHRKYQMSDYGNDRVGWGKTAINSWIPDRDNKAYAGQFIWTGFDYIGEPTPWHNEENLLAPSKSSYFGIFDTCGLEKMDYYFYKSQWISKDKEPFVKILPHWNFEDVEKLKEQGTDLKRDDNKIPVRVYSNLKNVELYLNGKSQGLKSFKEKTTSYGLKYYEGAREEELYLEWLVPYEKGQIEAKAFENRHLKAEDRIVTSGNPYKINLLKDSEIVKGESSFIIFEILDEEGNLVPTADNLVEFEAYGCEILGVDNGNAASQERYKASKDGKFRRKAFSGKGLVIVKPIDEEITVIAKSKDLKRGVLQLKATEIKMRLEDKLINEIDLDLSKKEISTRKKAKDKFVQAKNFSMAVKKESKPLFPLSTELYNLNGEKLEKEIERWDKISDLQYEAKVDGLVSKLYLRESDDVVLSYNYAEAWNGSEIPAGFASYTNKDGEDSILAINNAITSYDKNYIDRWSNISNKKREKDFVGIIFGRAGKLEKHSISHIRIAFFEDEMTQRPDVFTIRYFTKNDLIIPSDYGNLSKNHELNNLENFEEVKIIEEYEDDRFINIKIEDISTLAIRIDMEASKDKAIGITEIEVYGDIAKSNFDFDLEIFVDGEKLQDFNKEKRIYHIDKDSIPKIEVKATNNAAYTIIKPEDMDGEFRIIVTDEANLKERLYYIKLGGVYEN